MARIAEYMVHVDGEVDERERVLLDELQQEMGLPELPPLPDSTLVDRALGIFDDPVSRRIFLPTLFLSEACDHAAPWFQPDSFAHTLESGR